MKKMIWIMGLMALMLILVSCSQKNADKPPGMEGYVVSAENGRILVVDPNPQDFSSTGGVSEFYNAIWFSQVPSDIAIGDKVQVWFDAVAESYPGQSAATQIKVINGERPEHADIGEAEAIRRAFRAENVAVAGIMVIQSVAYDAESDVWQVHFKQDEQEWQTTIPDQVDEANLADPSDPSGEIPEVPVDELTKEFEQRLYQEVDEETREVLNFSSKAEWIAHMEEIMAPPLVQKYADEYYDEQGGKLYLIPRGGPPMLIPDLPYELTMIDESHAQVVQTNEDMMFGNYQLTVSYTYTDEHWVISGQEFESISTE